MKQHCGFIKWLLLGLVMQVGMMVHGQKNDYVWLQGYDSWGAYDPELGLYFGNPVMDFNYTPVKITRDSLSMYFDWTNTSFSDSDGNLLLYTNAIWIANSFKDTIENGDSLNWGYWLEYGDPSHGNEGYWLHQGIYALQSISNPNQVYLIHSLVDTNEVSAGAILSTLVDMSLNNGLGKAIYKNRVLLNDKVGMSFTITKHGNGKYWWIVVQKLNTNCYYRLLLDETGPHLVSDSTCGGLVYDLGDFGPMNFSQDGSKLITLGINAGLNIFDFDRCTGVISNPVSIAYPFLADSGWEGMGLATSPDSRYLYASLTNYLFQYDLTAADIPGSLDTVGIYDGFIGSFPTAFCSAQNGPDGKIYMSCGNSVPYYHVINNPDVKGALCNFVQDGVLLPSLAIGIPNFPNYRLGSLTQGQCDSLTTFTQNVRDAKEQILKVFPNPANDIATVDYGFTDWNKGAVSLEISNALGQVVYAQGLPMYSGFQRLDISRFVAGVYTVYVMRSGGVVAAQKLVVAH